MTSRSIVGLGLLLAAGCGGGTTGPLPPDPADCSAPLVVALGVGSHQVADPAGSRGCLRVGGAGADEEYLLAVFSGTGKETPTGVSGPYTVRIGNAGAVTATAPFPTSPPAAQFAHSAPPSEADRFHFMLRRREAELPLTVPSGPVTAPAGPAMAPQVGEQRTFKVCANSECKTFNDVVAKVRAVGQKVAIYADEANPQFAESLQEGDYAELVTAWDDHLYPIATSAFGAESDIDNNGVVLILITKRVNDFTPNCAQGRIVGYFFGADLLETFANSNKSEVFFTFAPSPATAQCSMLARRTVVNQLKPTLIHEFQHMISFNQHRLIRNGSQEETWLNEGLSHLAEDLAGQLIPNEACPGVSSCRGLYATPNLLNAHMYLGNTEAHALVFKGTSTGTLAERGAGFLFVRWLLDRYGTGENGFIFTRALVATNRLGQANIEAVTGQPMARLVGEWLATNYTDDLPDFTDPSGRLNFATWNFRTVMDNPANSSLFPGGFPLKPEVVLQQLTRSGTMQAGTGRYFLLRPGGAGKDILLSGASGSPLQPDRALEARIAVVRIR
ncbi:MAG TPA: hypothetical protein VMK53_00195 [Gemmatimonadales bacterium]|nr:hypothetical protein [Gemmatimonadales bacterium]